MMRKLEDIQSTLTCLLENHIERPFCAATTFLGYAENLIHWGMDDEKELSQAGLPYGYIYEVSKRCEYYKITDSLYEDQKITYLQVTKLWNDKVMCAERMKSRILATLGRCDSIVKGTHEKLDKYLENANNLTVAEKLQSLYEIAIDNKKNLIAWGIIDVEFDMMKKTIEEIQSMQVYLDNEEKREAEMKLMRNKAYTFLKQGLEQIINMGIYALWKEPERLMGYTTAKNNIKQEN